MKIKPVITAAYDAELLVHQWFEGHEWLNRLIRNCSTKQKTFKFVTPSEYIVIIPGIPMVEAAMNGMEGYLFNIIPGLTQCLACAFHEDNTEWKKLGFPVLGAVSGMLGCLMAIETIKLLTGYGKALTFTNVNV